MAAYNSGTLKERLAKRDARIKRGMMQAAAERQRIHDKQRQQFEMRHEPLLWELGEWCLSKLRAGVTRDELRYVLRRVADSCEQ